MVALADFWIAKPYQTSLLTQILTSIWHGICVLIICRQKLMEYAEVHLFWQNACMQLYCEWWNSQVQKFETKTVTIYYNPEFNGCIPASWYLLKLHWPEEFFKLLWEFKPWFMQTLAVCGPIFSLPPGSPEHWFHLPSYTSLTWT